MPGEPGLAVQLGQPGERAGGDQLLRGQPLGVLARGLTGPQRRAGRGRRLDQQQPARDDGIAGFAAIQAVQRLVDGRGELRSDPLDLVRLARGAG